MWPSRCLLPLGFCRKSLAQVLTVGLCIVPTDSDYRLIRAIEARIIPIGRGGITRRPEEVPIVLVRDFVLINEVRVQKHHVSRTFIVKGARRRPVALLIRGRSVPGCHRCFLVESHHRRKIADIHHIRRDQGILCLRHSDAHRASHHEQENHNCFDYLHFILHGDCFAGRER